ncbi:hypothetical protein CVS47_01187 [Microbacterium lemovicicum]|uniref:Uncharacterized protein n=1 Tax=Microbacterium lemovicicum TaxID=1072463 RepID=A0A3Q9J1S4_9MICO|nr:hypothetical protein [Microbacterium lemovicicum]AZS36580.1 hypothetical protein CVS47_01187 [Microbacterium lemovicicum]
MSDHQWNDDQAQAEADVRDEAGTPVDQDRTGADGHDAAATTSGPQPQYGVGPFSIREVALAGVWLVAFVASFFPLYSRSIDGGSVWESGIDWVLRIGVPTVAVFLIVLRRFSPQGIRRVGSLGIDQFASVAFSVASVLWLASIWNSFIALAESGVWIGSWVIWVEFVFLTAGVVLTVMAPVIPVLKDDFRDRPEIPAHRNARPIRAITPRPAPAPREKAAPPVASVADEHEDVASPDDHTSVFDAVHDGRDAAHDAPYRDGAPYQEDAPYQQDAPYQDAAQPGADGTGTPQSGYQVSGYPEAGAQERGYDDAGAQVPGYQRSSSVTDDQETGAYPPLADDTMPARGGAVADASVDDTWTPQQRRGTYEPAEAEPQAPSYQAFWALSPVEREVLDERGLPIFRVGPTAWALVIEDRGSVFVIRHEDGRVGYLHDVSGVTRG